MFKGCADGVHKFEPRYDRKFHDIINRMTSGSGDMDHMKENIYIKDVCVKCGKCIKRED